MVWFWYAKARSSLNVAESYIDSRLSLAEKQIQDGALRKSVSATLGEVSTYLERYGSQGRFYLRFKTKLEKLLDKLPQPKLFPKTVRLENTSEK